LYLAFNDKKECFVYGSSPYRAVNNLYACYKASQLMPYREIIAVFSEIRTKHLKTLCGQNVELLNVKPDGTYSDHWVLGRFTYVSSQLTIRRDVTKTVGVSIQGGLKMTQPCSNSNCACYKNININIYIYIYIYIEI